MTLNVERGVHGLWYITSREVKGLLIAAETRHAALSKVERAIADLEKASRAAE
jgi:t-SNARE complex subunit (syntaxin)